MRNFQFTRALALLLSLVLILSCLGSLRLPSAADEPAPDAIVVACSDFQNFEDSNGGGYTGSYTNNLALVNGILDAMDYPAIDGFVCGGDYNFTETMNSVSQTQTGIAALHDTVAARYPELPDERIVMVQGNHDAAGTPGMAVTGPYEADAYSLYVINEDDYMDRNTDEARIKATADSLGSWLAAKAAADYRRPIFVATHLPLHFTTRTQKNGDGQYAHYLFDVLNEYGEQLNIIFLFGHNHAFGYDSYMGASSILLQRGDSVKIAQLGSRTRYTEETLQFTYMNYGYTGYYWFNYNTAGGAVTENPPADGAMTMTSFEITGSEVVIHRWDENGLHNLKAPGARITKAMNGSDYEDLWEANELSYGPTVRVGLPTPPATYTYHNISVTTTAPIGGIDCSDAIGHETGMSIPIRPLNPVPEGYLYTVRFHLEAFMATKNSVVTLDGAPVAFTAEPDPENPAFGYITVRTAKLGAFYIVADAIRTSYSRVTDPDALPDAGSYLLFVSNTNKTSGSNLNADYLMLPESKYVSSAGTEVPLEQAYRTGFNIESALSYDVDNHKTIDGELADKEWRLERSGGSWLLKTPDGQGVNFAYKDASAATVTLSASDMTPLAIARYGSTDTFTIGTASPVGGVSYFFDYNTRGLICGYRAHANDVHFYLSQKQSAVPRSCDTSLLEQRLQEAEALTEADYTPASWAALAAAMAQAREVLAAAEAFTEYGDNRMQTQINQAWLDLGAALDGLVLTLEKQGITYEAVQTTAELTAGKDYYLVLWENFGQPEDSRGHLLLADRTQAVPASADYQQLLPDAPLPEESVWRLNPTSWGLILRHRQSGNYLSFDGTALAECPALIQLYLGLCGDYMNLALGDEDICLALEGEALVWKQMTPVTAFTTPSGANLLIYEKVVRPERKNLAPDTTVDAPAVSSWCNAGGVIDGVIPDSSDTGDYNVAYGSWNGSGSPIEQTITLSFEQPACIDGAAAYFWYNAGGMHTENGIDFPVSYTWEYLTEDGSWAEVPSPEGNETEPDVLNETTFEAVTTTALRIVMQKSASGSFGLGVAELALYGYYPVTEAQPEAADPSELELALAEANAIDCAPYTEASAQTLEAAIAAGLAALHDPEAAQAALDEARETIEAAVAALELRPDDPDPFRFDDVQDEDAYYFTPVYWAYNHDPQVTNGTSATKFSPNGTCTRAQVVTFLWRAMGCPAPETAENPFTDVEAGKYYTDAVLWAVENEITTGTDAATFSPGSGCTRAQVVTFLWRAAGKPAPASETNPFTDVTGGYYYTAVLWAVENRITSGTSATRFSPNATCTRAQIVTFLYRFEN